ncbi:hypothetical protein HYH03_003999 [Edaphochlamys debaryana]|uniref:Gamma-butyrobetaine hydroxylase-like N-terminal domain-containing protein n=1 Tax=Edaphochlamys debaryana TaxID=47281 RepID=A0A836C409_9CHLO|nr:hypothetical protein HYH03_003999 [Edaphochlamys debaryana]|eukprot:KAG2498249.1 hypothetical protein HYH03_003999 [Edaphochlamys debaryana]
MILAAVGLQRGQLARLTARAASLAIAQSALNAEPQACCGPPTVVRWYSGDGGADPTPSQRGPGPAPSPSARPPHDLGPPTAITVRRAERRLILTYADGTRLSLPAELLRVCSPSADTRRAVAGRMRVVSGRRHVGIIGVERVGNYAIRLTFDDLHSSGIFTWDYLAELGSAEGRWRAMRQYISELRASGLSRDPRAAALPRGARAAGAGPAGSAEGHEGAKQG